VRSRAVTTSTVVVTLVWAMAACGSSSTNATPAKDLETARLAVLDYRDVPAGYRGFAHDTSAELSSAQKDEFRRCVGASGTLFDDAPGAIKANSQDFKKDDSEITNSVTIHTAESELDDEWQAFESPKIEPCLEQLFRAGLGRDLADAGAKVTSLTVRRVPIETIGDRTAAFHVSVRLRAADGDASVGLDTLVASKGRAGVTLTASNLDRAIGTKLLRTVVDRLKGV
jgi:hypothetical protein